MKASLNKRIEAFAKKRGDWFRAMDVRKNVKGKAANIYVALSELKKKGVLVYNPNTGYIFNQNSKTVRVTAPKPAHVPARDGDIKTIEYLSKELLDHAEKYKRLHDQYVDALAIIRYLENKLFILIQGSENEEN